MNDPGSLQATVEGVELELHGTTYTVSILAHGEELLVVRVEDRDTLDCWRGEFAAKYVEDITSKTGSFKKFGVFTRMLQSAVLQQSDSVFVDLLTYQDLELLKAKKAAAASAAAASSSAAGASAQPPPAARALPPSVASKRYLILTYASEFDRVHYPLPLLADEQPDPARLRGVIASLRQQLAAVQAGLPPPGLLQPHAGQLQLALQGRQRSSSRCSNQARGSGCDDAALLASRLEVVQAELEAERASHRRELRRKARENQELQEELRRSRDVAAELRLRLKAAEAAVQEAAAATARHSSSNAAAAAGAGRGGYRRPAAADRYAYGGSTYLSGSSKFPSRPQRTSAAGNSRGSSPGSSRAQSPGYSRPWAQNTTPPRPPRPSSAPPKQRFDPTEYVRQKREREQGRLASSRSSSVRSLRSSRGGGGDLSGASSPRSAVSPSASLGGRSDRQAGLQRPGSGGGGSRQGQGQGLTGGAANMHSSGGGGGGRSSRQQRPGSSSSQQRLGAVYGVGPAGTAAAGSAFGGSAPRSRSGSAQRGAGLAGPSGRDGPGAASPGRALQGVRDKLEAYYAKQRQQQQQQQQQQHPAAHGAALTGGSVGAASPSAMPAAVGAALIPAAAIITTSSPRAAGPVMAAQQQAPSGVFKDASSEIADIDQRLHALQNFLKVAKSTVAAT